MLALFCMIAGSFAVMFILPAFLFTYLSLEQHLSQRCASPSNGESPSEAAERVCFSLVERATC